MLKCNDLTSEVMTLDILNRELFFGVLRFHQYIADNHSTLFVFGIDLMIETDQSYIDKGCERNGRDLRLLKRFLMALKSYLKVFQNSRNRHGYPVHPYDFHYMWTRVFHGGAHDERFRILITLNRESCENTLYEMGLVANPYGAAHLLGYNAWYRALRRTKIRRAQLPSICLLNESTEESCLFDYTCSLVQQTKMFTKTGGVLFRNFDCEHVTLLDYGDEMSDDDEESEEEFVDWLDMDPAYREAMKDGGGSDGQFIANADSVEYTG
jgi:hypothetical protein